MRCRAASDTITSFPTALTQLDKKKAALAVARADAKEAASGAIKLDPRDIALSNAKKADILTPALAAAGAHTPARLGSTSTSFYTHTHASPVQVARLELQRCACWSAK